MTEEKKGEEEKKKKGNFDSIVVTVIEVKKNDLISRDECQRKAQFLDFSFLHHLLFSTSQLYLI